MSPRHGSPLSRASLKVFTAARRRLIRPSASAITSSHFERFLLTELLHIVVVFDLPVCDMTDTTYLQQIEHCLDEIESLVRQKQEADRRIEKLQRLVKANAEM